MTSMARIILFIFILCGYAVDAAGQHLLRGQVLEKAGHQAIVGANVMVKSKSGNVLTFQTTDEQGKFSLSIPSTADSIAFEVTAIGFKAYRAKIKVPQNGPIQVYLEEGNIELKEVVVKSKRIRLHGDTITYQVAGFAKEQDRTIGDVLKRMPGIDVEESGMILYQGDPIKHFYIENSNLLEGKYGIATNGLNHKDIGAVEVMERHQPLQVLQGIKGSSGPAINLKLKDQSKATWVLNGHAGAGWSANPSGAIWDGELLAMTIFPKFQTITTLKSNNIGKNLARQVMDLLFFQRKADLNPYISLDLPSPPDFKENRTLFNQSHLFSTNNLWKIKNTEVKFQLDYYRQRTNTSHTATTTYYNEKENLTVREENTGAATNSRLTSNAIIETNQKAYYIRNALKTELFWDEADLSTTGTTNVYQKAKLPRYLLSNDLKMITRMGKRHLVTFTALNEWESLPQSLRVTRPDLGASLYQSVKDRAFSTKEQAEYKFTVKGFSVELKTGFQGFFREMNHDGEGLPDYINPSGHTSSSLVKYFVTPGISYQLKRIAFSLSYPFDISHYRISGLPDQTKFIQSPSLGIDWRPTGMLSLHLNSGLGSSPGGLHNIYSGTIMKDYRTFTQGMDLLPINTQKYISTSIKYRNVTAGLFGNLFAMKSWENSPYQSTREIRGNNILYSYELSPNKSSSFMSSGSISKTLDFMRGTVEIKGSYNNTAATMLSDGKPTSFASEFFNVAASINGNITDWANFSYEVTYNKATLSIDQLGSNSTHNFIHSFSCYLSPLRSLSLEVKGEYYNNQLTPQLRKDILLMDLTMTYKISKRVELEASLSNLFNKQSYAYTSFSTLSSIEHTKQIRGREVLFTIILSK